VLERADFAHGANSNTVSNVCPLGVRIVQLTLNATDVDCVNKKDIMLVRVIVLKGGRYND